MEPGEVGRCTKVHGGSNVWADMMGLHVPHDFCVATKRELDLAHGMNGVTLRERSGPRHGVPWAGDVHERHG